MSRAASGSWLQDEEFFLGELARGRQTEYRVALALLAEGLAVRIDARGRDPEADYSEQADLVVGERYVLEVKGRGLVFDSPETYPYPTVYVGSRGKWERRTESPLAVVVLSEPTGAMVVVPAKTRSRWALETCFDSLLGRMVESWAAPRECVRSFDSLVAFLTREILPPLDPPLGEEEEEPHPPPNPPLLRADRRRS